MNMKLNWSFLIDTALAITLLTSATLSAKAQEVTYYAQGHSSMKHSEVITVAEVGGSDYLIESSDKEVSSSRSISRELTLAVLIIAVCRLVQCNCPSQTVEQAKPSTSHKKPENLNLLAGLGLGSFYQSVNNNQKSNKKVKGINRVHSRNTTTQAGIEGHWRNRSVKTLLMSWGGKK